MISSRVEWPLLSLLVRVVPTVALSLTESRQLPGLVADQFIHASDALN